MKIIQANFRTVHIFLTAIWLQLSFPDWGWMAGVVLFIVAIIQEAKDANG